MTGKISRDVRGIALRASMVAGTGLTSGRSSRIVSFASVASGLVGRDGDSITMDRKTACTSNASAAPSVRPRHVASDIQVQAAA